MRFRVIELLVIISVASLACASLKRSDALFETIFFSFTLAFILGSILLAIGRIGSTRAFWSGFALTSLLYLVFAHIPDADEMVPRHNGPEITTQLLRHGFNWMHDAPLDTNFTPPSGGFFSVDDAPFDSGEDDDTLSATTGKEDTSNEIEEPFPSNFSLIIGSGQRVFAEYGRSMPFMRIGHAAWALFLGWIGGHFTQTVYQRSRHGKSDKGRHR